MTHARRSTAVLWALVTALSLAGVALTIGVWGDMSGGDAVSNLGAAPSAVLDATLGTLVVRRAGNVIGWFLLRTRAGHDRRWPAASGGTGPCRPLAPCHPAQRGVGLATASAWAARHQLGSAGESARPRCPMAALRARDARTWLRMIKAMIAIENHSP